MEIKRKLEQQYSYQIIDFEIKAVKQKRTLHNDQRVNPRRRYNNYKYIYTQHRSTSIHKVNTNIKAQISSNMIMGWALIPQFHQWTDDPDRKSKRK